MLNLLLVLAFPKVGGGGGGRGSELQNWTSVNIM